MAAEMARASGIPVEIIVVADDVALRDTVTEDRRRGIAGTVLVHKIAGAAAAIGLPLAEVVAVANSAATRVSSMGISLGSCTLPSVGKPGFVLGENEIEVGLGIHGEPGVRRMDIAPADELVAIVVDAILADGRTKSGDDAVILINGLGSTPPLELAILARAGMAKLRAEGVNVVRAWAGTFLSALDMPGFSISVLPVSGDDLALLDHPVDTLAWPGGGKVNRNPAVTATGDRFSPATVSETGSIGNKAAGHLREIFARIADALTGAEPELARLDGVSGDGDLGASMRRGADALRAIPNGSFSTASTALSDAADRIRKAIAGSSGPFYATALMRAARRLQGIADPTAFDIADAFSDAVQAIMDLGGAKPGDRTMVDALHPMARTFTTQVAAGIPADIAWRSAVDAGAEGMRLTSSMHPKLGRASYLGERAIGNPDAGAVAVVIWLRAVSGPVMRDADRS
ncbi:dihydroxyacetone kinase subunit DhaK [Rhizobium sp. RAF36]|uniref:dihydroxyacetone kinase subunit DhaK n=1 Tax=Rhizobium sp. RAF36 TaxID=3233055 RepID=UPI003F9A719F